MTLREIREKQGLTLRELADRIEDGPHYSTLARWERSNAVPVKYHPAVARALGVEITAIKQLSKPAAASSKQSHVTTDTQLTTWQQQLISSVVDNPNLLLVLLVLARYLDRTAWVVSGTIPEIAQSASLPVGLVEDMWPDVLASPFIERVGSGEWVLRLVFPDENK